jgi:hypothetical protein
MKALITAATMKRSFLAALVLAAVARLTAEEPVSVTIYDPDPNALWNRVRASLLSRVSPGDALDLGMTTRKSDYYKLALPGASNARALAVLQEFGQAALPPNISPLHRAIMQRDLLTVFHYAVNLRNMSDVAPEFHALIRALAKGIRRVALSEAEIRKLPDNYALAAAMPGAVHAFDPTAPKAFLPKDLLADDGEWIAVRDAQEERSITPEHDQVFMSCAVFEVRMRHPLGRKAGLDYLAQLPGQPRILRHEMAREEAGTLTLTGATGKATQAPPPVPEGEFPPGTAWALIRRSVLATPDGKPVISPLIDTVQVRVYRDVTFTGREAQFVFEWEAKPSLTLSGDGFHLVQPQEQWLQRFPAQHIDRPIDTMLCLACHDRPGRGSVLSSTIPLPDMEERAVKLKDPVFTPATQAQLQTFALRQLSDRPGWVLLPWLTEVR